jgi:hypothetical protein
VGPSDWDGGAIHTFMDDDRTNAYRIPLPKSRGQLLIFTTYTSFDRKFVEIVRNIDNILTWLGTPANFTVHVWLIDWPRRIAIHEWPGRLTVNGGFAVPGIPEIFVYREEEYDRVIIHEIIHAMKWDWKMPDTPLPCWGVQGRFMPHLFEAWTELYAEWLWCGWHNISWELQMRWMQLQATQILARFRRQGGSWNEDTNIYAYYILKAALAPHIAFLWIFGNGGIESERIYVLCKLVRSNLDRLSAAAVSVLPTELSMRMTVRRY